MGNNFGGFNNLGVNLPPNNNFERRDTYSTINNFNQNGFSNANPQFTSLDGRKWETKDQEFRANQEYYRKMLNDSMKKGD